MTLTIDLKPELEAQLREEAAKMGSDPNAFVVQALEERLQRKGRQPAATHLSQEESALLQKINQGLPEATWQEYYELVDKRRAESLTQEDQARLIALSDGISEDHAERMANMAELARLRNISLKTLMRQLKVRPRKI
jgi:predicted transcriptional regulator